MRAVSTVVDATVFLLLVGGAIGTLVAGPGSIPPGGDDPGEPGNPAAETARLLATNTATVNYSLEPATRSPDEGVAFHRMDGSGFERSAHGTLASLLADGAVGNATIEGTQLSRASDEFERGVVAAVRDQIRQRSVRTSVVAVWEPYPDAPLRGYLRVGDRPPHDVDVHAATMRVESGIPPSGERARRAAADGGRVEVARVVAESVVEGLLPPRETRLALRDDYPADALAAHRYRRSARALGEDQPGVGEVAVEESNQRLVSTVAARFEADLADRYDSPRAAARDVETGTTTVTVRTWSP